MVGVQILPALLFYAPHKNLTELNLGDYEILNNEPLHDISHHTQNIYDELAYHLPKEMKTAFKKVKDSSFNGKEAKNGSDYRDSLIIVATWFLQNRPFHFATDIIITLAEIQEILYSPETKRSIQSVFCLHNVTFCHVLLLKIHMQDNIISMTRKFFGSYYHSLIKHSPEQYRILSGRLANTEKEEATFNFIKVVNNLTSNHHLSNIIANAIIRMQAKSILNKGLHHESKESTLNEAHQSIKSTLKNTEIPYIWIKKYKYQYQCLLESQADYILDNVRWWKETDDGIEFSDISNAPKTTMQLAHFRSTSIQGQLNYVKKCWNQLLLLKEKIPAFQIQSKEENWTENTDIELLNLGHFKTKAKASDESHATFISTSENAKSTPLSNRLLDQNEASDIDFNTALSFDINKNDETMVTSTENILSSTPTPVKNFQIPKSPPEILSLRSKEVTLKRNKPIYSKSTHMLLKLFAEVEFVKQYDFLRKQLKTSKTAYNIKKYNTHLILVQKKLDNLKSNLEKQIKEIETRTFDQNDELTVYPHDSSARCDYERVFKKLTYISALQKQVMDNKLQRDISK